VNPFQETAMNLTTAPQSVRDFELRFQCLFDTGRGYAFPCDAAGHVDLDALGERALNRYLYARTVIGREFAMPKVQPRATALN
jgi:hypothetical protein